MCTWFISLTVHSLQLQQYTGRHGQTADCTVEIAISSLVVGMATANIYCTNSQMDGQDELA